MKQYLYLFINIGSIAAPFLASFYPKHAFYKHWKNYFVSNFIIASLFIIWDIYFTKIGVWGFNKDYLTGLELANIPIEEVLFFFCIPYASVFVYFALNFLVKKNPFRKFHSQITLSLIAILMFFGLLFANRWYTSVTFILTAVFLLLSYLRKQDLSKIYFSFSVTLIFFFIVNGILTGSFLEQPVVWYNNAENIGIRIGTIPVEDIVYGFLLIASIIQLFEFLNTKSKEKIID